MNAREKFLSAMLFQGGPPPSWEFFGPWGETLHRWIGEGLDRKNPMADLWKRDGSDSRYQVVPVKLGLLPPFQHQVLEETENDITFIDGSGIMKRQLKGTDNMPEFIKHPVQTRQDWEAIKERLDPHDPARFPADWAGMTKDWENRDYPLGLGEYPYGFFGTLRDLMGVENLLMGFYDQPDLIRDMMNYLAEFWANLWAKVLSQVKVDFVQIWEDMSFKNGPLISPAMVEEFMVPCYKKLLGLAHDFGVKIALVDTDGNCWSLISPFVGAGVTGFYPFEAAAGMDIREVRARHPRLQVIGGIDKLAIAKGPSAIDAELEAKLPSMLKSGGYIPSLDHLVPPEVSLENYLYYRRRVKDYIEQM